MMKPIPVTQPAAYDFHACRDWINKVHQINMDDYSNCYGPEGDSDRPFQSFWHWVVEHCDISNGCYFGIDFVDEITGSETEPWEAEIMQMFVNEFAPNDNPEGYTHWFWVDW